MNKRQVFYIVLIIGLVLAFTGCSGGGGAANKGGADGQAEAPLAQAGPPAIAATGMVLPESKAAIGFSTSGQLVELLVEVGDNVEKGDLIARLDTTNLDSEVVKAEAALKVAQANLALARADPRTEQLREAESNLAAAAAAAEQASASADQIRAGSTETEILQAQADVQAAFIDMINKRALRDWYEEKQKELKNSSDFWDILSHPPGAQEGYDLDYEVALENLQAAQAYLDALLDEPNPDELKIAEAELWAASAEYLAQKAQINLMKAGTAIVDINVVEANVRQAEVALEQAQLNRQKAFLYAPFKGTITELYVREAQYVNAGQQIFLLADLTVLYVETTDLNEIDVTSLAVGDRAIVTFDALPGVTVDGTVVHISPKAQEGAGVNFLIKVSLDAVPDRLRWGMTAFVDFPQDR